MKEVRFGGRFWASDRPPADPAAAPLLRLRVVSRDYFRAMGIPLLAGRDFEPQDSVGEVGRARVVIINESLARLFWSGGAAVGRTVVSYWESTANPAEVVGVVQDVRYTSMDNAPVPEVYLPDGLFPQDELSLVVRTESDAAAMTAAIRGAIQEVERDVFIGSFQTMDEIITASVSRRRFIMRLLSTLSSIAVVLALAGIAGIVAYSLSLRSREVGIRLAVGASPRDVILLISRQGLLPSVSGLILGLLLAAGLNRFLGQMLYGVSPYDPAVFVLATVGVAAASVLAALVSAHRACSVDPAAILK